MECVCTGKRVCASCVDPEIRQRRHNLILEPEPWLGAAVTRLVTHDGVTTQIASVVDGVPQAPASADDDLLGQVWPEGLRLVPEAISLQVELQCLETIQARDWTPSQGGRRKQDFGPKVNFKKRRLKVEGFEGFPGYAHRLLIPQLVGQLPDLTSWVPHELVALEYSADRGSNIDLHRDDTWVWGPRIVGVNMQAGAWMLFVSDLDPSTAVEVWLPPRSAYLLQGPARYHWRHGVRMGRVAAGPPRVSVTFRELTEDVLSSPEGEQVALRAGRIVC